MNELAVEPGMDECIYVTKLVVEPGIGKCTLQTSC